MTSATLQRKLFNNHPNNIMDDFKMSIITSPVAIHFLWLLDNYDVNMR